MTIAKTEPQFTGAADKNIGDAGHAVSGCQFAGDDLLPRCVRGDDTDRFKGALIDVQHEIAHVFVQRGHKLVEFAGRKEDRFLEKKDVGIDVGVQKLRVRAYEAHPERGKTAFFAHAADVEKDLADLLQNISGGKLLVVLHIADSLVIEVVYGIYKG